MRVRCWTRSDPMSISVATPSVPASHRAKSNARTRSSPRDIAYSFAASGGDLIGGTARRWFVRITRSNRIDETERSKSLFDKHKPHLVGSGSANVSSQSRESQTNRVPNPHCSNFHQSSTASGIDQKNESRFTTRPSPRNRLAGRKVRAGPSKKPKGKTKCPPSIRRFGVATVA